MSEEPDRQLVVELNWMRIVNDKQRCGRYGSSLVTLGPVEWCEEAVRRGYAHRSDSPRQNERGYWITQLGEDYLNARRRRK